MSDPEQRVHSRIHARVHVQAAIQIATSDGMMDVELRDLSKGGARFLSPKPVGRSGDTVDLYLPSLNGQEVTVMAEIIRADAGPTGIDVAVRFALVEPEQRQALVDLIEELLTSTGAAPEPGRSPRRIELQFASYNELKSLLEDVLHGALSMTVDEALVLYEELTVIVPDLSGQGLLMLRSRVVHQRRVEHKSGGEITRFRVGLEFPDMPVESEGCVRELLRVVAEAIVAQETATNESTGHPSKL